MSEDKSKKQNLNEIQVPKPGTQGLFEKALPLRPLPSALTPQVAMPSAANTTSTPASQPTSGAENSSASPTQNNGA